MKDISSNPGILPIRLGTAKIITTDHTLIHYYKIDGLIREFDKLKLKNVQLFRKLSEDEKILRELDEYSRVIDYTVDLIQEKIDSIKHVDNRKKRGLIDGLGSVVKAITGNLDATDAEKYDKFIEQIRNNNLNFQDQLDAQFSINSELIEEFNETINTIQFNNREIQNKVMEINSIIKANSIKIEIGTARELVNHLQIIFNLVLNVVQDIENSLSFCKMGSLHPSILTTKQLYEELKKIENYYQGKLPLEIKYENMLELESLIKVNCKVRPEEIVYFLTLPLTNSKEFELFFLRPIPSETNNGLISIWPESQYLLKAKDNSTIKPLKGSCISGSTYLCPTEILSTYNNSTCEREILQGRAPKQCKYVKLETNDNEIEFIQEINQYLATFVTEEPIEIREEKETEIKLLKGIYLIRNEKNTVYFRNEQLISSSQSEGQPKIIRNAKIDMEKNYPPDVLLNIKDVNFKDIKLNRVRQLSSFDTSHIVVPSGWTIILYLIMVGLVCYFSLKYFRKSKSLNFTNSPPVEPRTCIDINLPGDAKF